MGLGLGALTAFFSSVTWSVGTSVFSLLSHRCPPHAINATRAFIGFVAFALILTLQRGPAGMLDAAATLDHDHWFWLGTSVLGSYALGDVFFFRSANRLGVPSALAIASSYPIWSALAAWVFRGQGMSALRFAGLLLTVAGVIIVVLQIPTAPKDESLPRSRLTLDLGVLYGFLASICWTYNTYAISKGGEGVSPVLANMIRMGFAFLVAPLIGFLMVRKLEVFVPWSVLRKYGWAFVVETVLGGSLFLYGLSHTPLAVGASLSSLAPVLAVPIGLWMGTETFNAKKLAGILAVVFGVFGLVSG